MNTKNYSAFLIQIKERIKQAQYDALRLVNHQLINLYWDIGKMIVETQTKQKWGKSVVETLAKDLQKEYAGIKGFSVQNLWNMRQFYIYYHKNQKLQPLVREISWVKNIIILNKCKTDDERQFYLSMTKKFGWTKNILIHQIENNSYKKYQINQTNFDMTLPEEYKTQAKMAIKDEYTFDFLHMGNIHTEKQLENSLTEKIRLFLTELGGYFCFIGSQYRLEVNGQEFFIDLLLFHRKLRCLVALELKIGEFKPEYVGKIQFYLSILDDKIKLNHENPSMGIIICKSKNRTIVEYALKDVKKPLGVSTYTIMKELPKHLLKYFPNKEEISQRLS